MGRNTKPVADKQSEAETRAEEEDYETKCGVIGCHPNWLQYFANGKTYVLVYSLLGMLWHIVNSYFIGTLTTMEKNFKMSSQTLGVISGAAEIGGLISNLALTYVAEKGHRIRWVSFGMLMIGLSCFMRVIPHYANGLEEDLKPYTKEYSYLLRNPHLGRLASNTTGPQSEEFKCDPEDGKSDKLTFYIFLMAHVVLGIGNSLYWTCGATYMDDNSPKKDFPLLFAITLAIRIFGQTGGYLLSSYTLKIFVNPGLTPTIEDNDPKWIGAWWIGWHLIGVFYFVLGGLFVLFPRRLPRTAPTEQDHFKKNVSFSDFAKSMKRILRNKIIVFESCSAICFTLGLAAYGTFWPKYIESQFGFSPSKSNFLVGIVGIFSKASGILVNGILVSKLKPTSRSLIGFNMFIEFVSVIGHISYVFVSCPPQNLQGHWNNDRSWNLTETCNTLDNRHCNNRTKYSPVCHEAEKRLFYSACHAGCTSSIVSNDTKSLMYDDCSCVPNNGYVMDGQCESDCTANVIKFIMILGFLKFLRGTVRSIKPLIQLRSVDKEDKSLTIGVSHSILSIMALIPAPILYGMIMDFTCIVWEDNCGTMGNCWLYDRSRLRNILNYTASSFLLLGILLDCIVWYYVKDLKMYDEDVEIELKDATYRRKSESEQD